MMFTHDATNVKKIKGAADKNRLKTLRVNKALGLVYTYRQRQCFLWAAPLIFLTLRVNRTIGLRGTHLYVVQKTVTRRYV